MTAIRVIDRYELHDELARGGMGSVHIARLRSDVGFSRTVAIKCVSPMFAGEEEFSRMFADEARASSRIAHSNVVSVLDVIERRGELFLVMDYCAGESLATLWRIAEERKLRIPLAIASAIIGGALQGLHAAHEATAPNGEHLGLVHRDVSPQNILVGADGVTRVVDFGIAKAKQRLQPTTNVGNFKGKLGYLAPETVRGRPATTRTDIYAAGVVLWELVTGERMFDALDREAMFEQIAIGLPTPPSAIVPDLPEALEIVITKALETDPARRFESARAMERALAAAVTPVTATEVADWVESLAHDSLAARAALVARVEALPPVEPAEDTVLDTAPVIRAPPLPRRSRLAAVVGALLTMSSVASVLVIMSGRRAPPKAPPPDPIIVTTATTTSATPPEESPPEPTATSITAPPPTTPRVRAAGAARVDCRVPYTLDSSGKRIYKRACL